MAIFNSYVKLPEGTHVYSQWHPSLEQNLPHLNQGNSSGAARRQQGAKKAKFCQPDLLIHVDSSVDLSFLLRLRSKQSNVEQLRLTSALICRGNQINTKWNWYIDVHRPGSWVYSCSLTCLMLLGAWLYHLGRFEPVDDKATTYE